MFAGDKAFKFHDYALSHSQDSYGVRTKTTTTATKQSLKARNSYSQDDNYVSRLSHGSSTKLKNRRTTWAAKSNRFDTGSKINFGDILWLHLQAWKAGKSLKKDEIYQSLVEIDQRIVEKRSKSLSIFDEIKSFVIDYQSTSDQDAIVKVSSSNQQIFNDLNHWPLTFDSHVSKLSSTVKKQYLALCRVHNLLEKYHKFGQLFPDYRTFENYTTDHQTKDVFEKLQVLNVWSSIVRDIGRKMKNIGKIFTFF
uniref:Mitogen-activated protein kinase kinase kinase N-terminal domain-containing protein n=1 Tax=Romanomermis culicivorax TaxID=13658 RepID=A0A915K8W7_ROMCU